MKNQAAAFLQPYKK